MIEWVVCLVLGFILGHVHGSTKAITKLQNDISDELEKILEQTTSLELLRVEKVNDCFYAYVGDVFLTQSKDLHELFREVRKNPKAQAAGVDFDQLLENFSTQDRKLAAQAILDTWSK